ncbi:MAG: hypothetical protein DWQ19_11530 [Crenarchaeota archaeon]|nr:MAG: hypothetical protein DWQ19_11530 [Thermoproteota archaeon]
MNNIKIKYISARNFLCFGPDGIEINFDHYGNVVLVRGDNLDIDPDNEEERRASNGVGKTSICDIIVYGLFGHTVKKLKNDNIINNQIGKKLRVEIIVDDYRIVRTRSPNSLKVWQSASGEWTKETELSLGGMTDTQKWIDNKVGLTYKTFCNLVVFTDNNAGSFLECDTKSKREIVENLLSLDVYREYGENAKKLRNTAKDATKNMGYKLDAALSEKQLCENRINNIKLEETTWKDSKKTELKIIVDKYKAKESELKTTDTGQALAAYQEAQEKIEELNEQIELKEEKVNKLQESLVKNKDVQNEVYSKLSSLDSEIKNFNIEISGLEKRIANDNDIIKDIESQKCIKCGYVDENLLEKTKKDIQDKKQKLTQLTSRVIENKKLYDEDKETLTKISETVSSDESKLNEIVKFVDVARKHVSKLSKVERPEISLDEKVIEEQLNELKNQILKKKEELDGPSPYVKIMQMAVKESEEKQKECEEKKLELDEANKELPYYEFWVNAFGDKGIRKFIIDGIIPALNARIEYWLQFLIDGKISLRFDNELEPEITRNPVDGDKFVYDALSGGERRRANLAVSQGIAHVMMLNCGTCPSIVFLDEVTTNIDPIGVQGVYNMIAELAKERQVFITTHDHDLLEMLRAGNCDTINLIKKGGFSKLVSPKTK